MARWTLSVNGVFGSLSGFARAALVACASLGAATAGAVTIDFRSVDDTSAGPGYGNSLSFSNGGISLIASALAETGPGTGGDFYLFRAAEIFSWDSGLGICNQTEGTANVTCDNNGHEVDTVGRDDLLVLVFDQPVVFESILVDAYDGVGDDPNDRDVIYWVGNLASLPDLTSYAFDTLGSISGLDPETKSPASSGFGLFSHALSGVGNVLLLSGNYHDRCEVSGTTADIGCEAYKIVGINVSAVPVPAVAWILVPVFGLLGLRRRRPRH